jgi:hypothetical protein
MKLRIYTDTSVLGGCLDDEFEDASVRLVEMFKSGEAVIVVSDLTLLELENAPAEILEVLEGIPEEHREYVELTQEADELARGYVAAGVIVEAKRVDAQHIAIATVNRVDVLVSWNFKPIVNLARIHGYNSVNLRWGYPLLEVRSPREVIGHEE